MSKKLQTWMSTKGMKDHQVAKAIGVSRVQISRIRRGVTGASVKTAMRLQELTGLKWWSFVRVEDEPRAKKKAA